MAELQKKIEELLKNIGTEMSINDIYNELLGEANQRAIRRAVKKLLKYNEISCIKIEVEEAKIKYGKKVRHGLRLYSI